MVNTSPLLSMFMLLIAPTGQVYVIQRWAKETPAAERGDSAAKGTARPGVMHAYSPFCSCMNVHGQTGRQTSTQPCCLHFTSSDVHLFLRNLS